MAFITSLTVESLWSPRLATDDWRLLSGAQFLQDGERSAGADAAGAGFNHRFKVGCGADASGSFNAGAIAHSLAHQGHVGGGCSGRGKAGGGLHEVGFRGQTDFTRSNFLFIT